MTVLARSYWGGIARLLESTKREARRTRHLAVVGWLAVSVSGCAAILGNDYEVDVDAGLGTGASSGSTGITSTNAAGAGGGSSAGGRAGASGATTTSSTSGASGSGGNTADGGSSGAGGDLAGTSGAAGGGGTTAGGGASGTGGGAGSTPDASTDGGAPDASFADETGPEARADATQGAEPAFDGPASSDAPGDEPAVDVFDSGGTRDTAPEAPVCNPVNGSCAGGALTCNAAFSSCNGSVSDGCECATSGCCGSSCQVQHAACMLNGNPGTPCTDGTGKYFYDCVAAGTITNAQAAKACAAVTGNASSCSSGMCGANLAVCSFDASGDCVCWEYSGTAAGRVFKSNNPNCYCPISTSPTWN